MLAREREGKEYGVIVIAEGMAEYLPMKHLEGVTRDDHGHIKIADINLGTMFAKLIAAEYKKQTGKKRQGEAGAARLRSPLHACRTPST